MFGIIGLAIIGWLVWATLRFLKLHGPYFQAMGQTREVRKALYDDVDEIVHPALDRLEGDGIEGLRAVLIGCIPAVASAMASRGLLPKPHAMVYLLARSLETGPPILKSYRKPVWQVLQSLEPELQRIFLASIAARN